MSPVLTKFLGRNGQKAPTEVSDLECTKCQNLLLSGHSLKVRGGIVQELADSADTTDPIWGLHRSYIVDGTPFWLYSLGTLVRSTRTGSQATIKTLAESNKGVGFVECNGSIYILPANTTDKVQKSDGTAGGTADHADADTPKASIGLWKHNRLFLNDLNNFERLWCSDTNTPDTFRAQDTSTVATEGGFIRFSLGDGDRIKAIAELGSAIIVFKERSIHMLLGTSFTGDETFRVVQLFKGVGTKSPRSVVAVENGLMFLDSDGLVRYFHGPSRTLISGVGKPIEDLTTAIPSTLLEEAAATYHQRRYVVSFAAAGGSVNTLDWAFDLRFFPAFADSDEPDFPSLWTEITGAGFNAALVANGQTDAGGFYYGDAASTGKIWRLFSGTTDNGSAISYAYKTKAYGADAPTVHKSVSEVTTLTRTMSAAVTHEVYADLATTATVTKALTPSSTTHSVNTWKPGETARGSIIQAGFTGSTSIGGEVLSLSWDWNPKRKEPVDG